MQASGSVRDFQRAGLSSTIVKQVTGILGAHSFAPRWLQIRSRLACLSTQIRQTSSANSSGRDVMASVSSLRLAVSPKRNAGTSWNSICSRRSWSASAHTSNRSTNFSKCHESGNLASGSPVRIAASSAFSSSAGLVSSRWWIIAFSTLIGLSASRSLVVASSRSIASEIQSEGLTISKYAESTAPPHSSARLQVSLSSGQPQKRRQTLGSPIPLTAKLDDATKEGRGSSWADSAGCRRSSMCGGGPS